MLPMKVHESAKIAGLIGFEGLLNFEPNFFDEAQILDIFFLRVLETDFLLLENVTRGAVKSSKEHEQIVFQIMQGGMGNLERTHRYRAGSIDFKTVHTTVRRNELVLLAHRFFQQIH